MRLNAWSNKEPFHAAFHPVQTSQMPTAIVAVPPKLLENIRLMSGVECLPFQTQFPNAFSRQESSRYNSNRYKEPLRIFEVFQLGAKLSERQSFSTTIHNHIQTSVSTW